MNNHPLFKTGDYVSPNEGITPGIYRDILEVFGIDFSSSWCGVVESFQLSGSSEFESMGLLSSGWYYKVTELYPDHGKQHTLNEDFISLIEPDFKKYDLVNVVLGNLINNREKLTRIGDLLILEAEPWQYPFLNWTLGTHPMVYIDTINYDRILSQIAS